MRFIALDIETDTDATPVDPEVPAGLDPRAAAVISAALWDTRDGSSYCLTGDEALILARLEELVCAAGDGVLVTWNGANFDLPYLAHRYEVCGIPTTLALTEADNRPPKYSPLPGKHATGYWATWGGLVHLDVAFAYQRVADELGVTWSLKTVATALGIEMVTVDREQTASLTADELERYNVSDVRGTAALAERLGDDELAAWLDPQPVRS